MKPMIRCASTLLATLALTGCASLNEMDRNMLGQPSPAVAMYAAQLHFSHATCGAQTPGLDPAKSAAFVTYSADRGLSTAHYIKNYPEFRQYVSNAQHKYQVAHHRMPQHQRGAFCAAYRADVAASGGAIRTVQKSIDFREYFSPPTAEHLERSRNGVVALGVLSAGATIAGIAQSNRGNFDGATTLNQAGGMFADGMAAPNTPIACASYRPFAQAPAPAENNVWASYHSIQTCG